MYIKESMSFMGIVKDKQMGLNRYDKITDNINDVPKETRGFVKNISEEFDSLLLHVEDNNVPTTNNLIELYNLTTFNRRDKKKYETMGGVMEDTSDDHIWNRELCYALTRLTFSNKYADVY